jgi:hypothetical protein
MIRLQMKSPHAQGLSEEARQRYEQKILATEPEIDPYSIDDASWNKEPEVVPQLNWTALVTYMVSTPSPYTKESVKVNRWPRIKR